jgi:CBS-domain-containing membrane protein
MRSPAPQQTFLFRIIALISRCQLRYLVGTVRNLKPILIAFVALEGITAIGTIAAIAYLTKLPLLFPPLGPSAFILFYTPMAPSASPRTCILSHTMGLAAGLVSLSLAVLLFPTAGLAAAETTHWFRVIAIAMAMGLISVLMILTKTIHPPAAATALIAVMGYLQNPVQVAGFIAAVVLLVAEACLFNRILGGLPYPLWKPNPEGLKEYGALAGLPETNSSYWGRLSEKVFAHRLS